MVTPRTRPTLHPATAHRDIPEWRCGGRRFETVRIYTI